MMKKLLLIVFLFSYLFCFSQGGTSNQSTGGVNLGPSTSLVAGSGITLTKGVKTTTITATNLATGLTGIVPIVNGGTNNTINASNYSIVTKDSTTDAVMYPFFGTATSGNLLVKNSGLNLNYIPKNSQLGLGINPKSVYRVENNELYGMSMRTTKDTNFIFAIQHDGNGSKSYATFRAINNLHYVADWGMVNSSAADAGIQLHGMAGLYTNNPTGMSIMCDANTSYLKFAVGSSAESMSLSAGALSIGINGGKQGSLKIAGGTSGSVLFTVPNSGSNLTIDASQILTSTNSGVSGTWTPTCTATTNTDAVSVSSGGVFSYVINGTHVNFSGYLSIDPTLTLTATEVRITTPPGYSSTFSNAFQAQGAVTAGVINSSGEVFAEIAGGNTLRIYLISQGTTAVNYSVIGHYEIH